MKRDAKSRQEHKSCCFSAAGQTRRRDTRGAARRAESVPGAATVDCEDVTVAVTALLGRGSKTAESLMVSRRLGTVSTAAGLPLLLWRHGVRCFCENVTKLFLLCGQDDGVHRPGSDSIPSPVTARRGHDAVSTDADPVVARCAHRRGAGEWQERCTLHQQPQLRAGARPRASGGSRDHQRRALRWLRARSGRVHPAAFLLRGALPLSTQAQPSSPATKAAEHAGRFARPPQQGQGRWPRSVAEGPNLADLLPHPFRGCRGPAARVAQRRAMDPLPGHPGQDR